MTTPLHYEPPVVWFSEVGAESVDLVGGKCASLGELCRVGVPVPSGFAVTTHAHGAFLRDHGIEEVVGEEVRDLDYGDVVEVQAASSRIRAYVEGCEVPSAVQKVVLAHYEELMDLSGGASPVAVRSSATAEDHRNASFAGQLDTFLWIRDADQVIRHLQLCWAGLYTPQALSYRNQFRRDDDQVLMSVAVQQMVDARSAGVMFTLNPINGDRSKIMVESCWGLGEGIVKGEVDPDRYLIDKVTLRVLESHVAEKMTEYRFAAEEGGVVACPVPDERRAQPSISDDELIELVRFAREIEGHYGRPQDIEWAMGARRSSEDHVHILQSRDETVWSQRTADNPAAPGVSALDRVVAKMSGLPT
ncbi:MAG: PEP/pyruvate-binding domain-containing protein [Acidimicrobiales bacterium]